jgi:hypothetical protein
MLAKVASNDCTVTAMGSIGAHVFSDDVLAAAVLFFERERG